MVDVTIYFKRHYLFYLLRQIDLAVIFVHARDMGNTDLFGAGGFAFVGVGTITKLFFVHLADHIKHARFLLGFPLRQMIKM